MTIVNAEFIQAVLDGKTVQYKLNTNWIDVLDMRSCITLILNFSGIYNFRIKPEPKPDFVRYINVYRNTGYSSEETATNFALKGMSLGMCKTIFDGETGKLKSVEIVE